MVLAGIDLGGTNIKAALVDGNLKLIAKSSIPTNAGRDARQIIADMAGQVISLADKAGLSRADISGVGIGIPGVAKDGNVIALHNLHWHNVALLRIFKEFLDVPVFIDNDGTVAAVYEYHLGVLAGCNVGVLLTLGTGIGGGIIIDGKPFSGAHGLGSELGHMTLIKDGLQCTCGNKGCFEVYASATALVRYGRQIVIERPESLLHHAAGGDYRSVTAKMVMDSAKDGDIIALRVIDDYSDCLATGIASIMNSLDPEVIALGGGVSAAGDFLLNKVIAAMDGKGVFAGQKYADIRIAKSGNDAGLIGAAMLAK